MFKVWWKERWEEAIRKEEGRRGYLQHVDRKIQQWEDRSEEYCCRLVGEVRDLALMVDDEMC